ncbi:MAG: hypothetical protein AAFY15_07450 [Cyanobacteria bacterium J06648_11]
MLTIPANTGTPFTDIAAQMDYIVRTFAFVVLCAVVNALLMNLWFLHTHAIAS